jgi:hypothetical protein
LESLTKQAATDSLLRHLASPDVSIREHLRRNTALIGEFVESRYKLCLDTRYWVFLRDAALGRAKRPEHDLILAKLRFLVGKGVAICPVSDVAFMELTTQSDDVTRAATAALWDELSLGVALLSSPYRARCELENTIRYPAEEWAKYALRAQVWTRACYVLGPAVPTNDAVPADRLQAIQKAVVDSLWKLTFSDLARDSSVHLEASKKFNEMAEKINIDMRQFQHEVPSFEKAFMAEIAGVLTAHQDDVNNILLAMFEERGSTLDQTTRQQFIEFRDEGVRTLVNGFRYARTKMATRLPSVYIHAICHAAIRMDVKRKFNGNFLRDLHHGNAGVAYHHALFTETPLRVLLTARNVAVDKTLGCCVLSDEADVISYLGDLKSPYPRTETDKV